MLHGRSAVCRMHRAANPTSVPRLNPHGAKRNRGPRRYCASRLARRLRHRRPHLRRLRIGRAARRRGSRPARRPPDRVCPSARLPRRPSPENTQKASTLRARLRRCAGERKKQPPDASPLPAIARPTPRLRESGASPSECTNSRYRTSSLASPICCTALWTDSAAEPVRQNGVIALPEGCQEILTRNRDTFTRHGFMPRAPMVFLGIHQRAVEVP